MSQQLPVTKNSHSRPLPQNTIGGLLTVVVVGIILMGMGVFVFQERKAFERTAERATGRVVRVLDAGRRNQKQPEVEYTTQSGQPVVFRNLASSDRYSVGETVSVLYRPTDPQTARIDSVERKYRAPVILLSFGVLTVMLGVYGFWRLKRMPE